MSNTSAKDMTTGKPLKLILAFCIPVLFGNLFQQFYNMADTVIVGRFVGEEALAAVGSTGCIMFLVLGFANGIAQGFGVMVSHAYGAKDSKLLKHYIALSLLIGVIVSVVVTILTVSLSRSLLVLMKTPDNIIDMANGYIRIIFLGIAATMFYNIGSSILRGIGDSKTPLYFLILSSVLNVILDLFFIINLDMGPNGAALATVIAQGVSALLCFIYMFKRYDILRTTKSDYYFDSVSTKNLLMIGLPMALNYSITAIGTMALQTAVNAFGSSVVAAYTAASKVESLSIQTMPALGTAMATYCGQNLGAGKYDRIFDGMKKAFWIAVGAVISGMFINMVFGKYIIRLFLENPSPEITSYSVQYLDTIALFYFWLAMIFLYRTALQGLNQALMPMLSGVFELVCRFAVVAIMLEPFGYWTVRLASPVAWFGAAIPLMISYYLWKRKMTRSFLSQPNPREE